MSHGEYGYGYGYEAAMAGLIELALVICLISLYLLVRAAIYVVQTGVKYPVKAFWISLAVFGGGYLLDGLLSYSVGQSFGVLAYGGAGQLLIACKVIQTKYAGIFMRDEVSFIEAMLHRKWWADDNTPVAA